MNKFHFFSLTCLFLANTNISGAEKYILNPDEYNTPEIKEAQVDTAARLFFDNIAERYFNNFLKDSPEHKYHKTPLSPETYAKIKEHAREAQKHDKKSTEFFENTQQDVNMFEQFLGQLTKEPLDKKFQALEKAMDNYEKITTFFTHQF